MGYELRPIPPDDLVEAARAEAAGFGEHLDDQFLGLIRANIEYDRSLAVYEAGRPVATAGAYSYELTLPGLTTAPVAAVTAVAVLPTHRRRGLLTRMMAHQLDDVRARGEALAVLTASESIIYGRFGYGPATYAFELEIDAHRGAFGRPVEAPGRLRLLGPDEPAKVLPAIYDRYRRAQPGELGRPPGRWQAVLHDPCERREGATAYFFVVHEDDAGEADGYVTYRMAQAEVAAHHANRLLVRELVSADPLARAALWRYCLDVDLVASVQFGNAPVDDPVRWMLADPRRLRVTVASDWLWVRILDVPAALEGRGYTVDGELVLEVADAFRPETAGRYVLDAGPDGASCRPTDREPDLVLGIADLGALYLGGTAATTLARAGRLREETSGVITRADALFACQPAPFCGTDF